jgi:hypothetical protein
MEGAPLELLRAQQDPRGVGAGMPTVSAFVAPAGAGAGAAGAAAPVEEEEEEEEEGKMVEGVFYLVPGGRAQGAVAASSSSLSLLSSSSPPAVAAAAVEAAEGGMGTLLVDPETRRPFTLEELQAMRVAEAGFRCVVRVGPACLLVVWWDGCRGVLGCVHC